MNITGPMCFRLAEQISIRRQISSQSMIPLFFKFPFLLFTFPTASLDPTAQYLRVEVLVMPGDNMHRED